ncbi:hypothetical protein C8P68_102634 [Mucilaginibacter yixingensis]|uniref:Uncharacterized protein n=1 Tax=Mucilaginibacter yixingensis TaxID=1295612 RepID=A0A2T5JDH5_9SPHI|nr:DUF6515 family protein [Mucilaginibacter yixingensis]PTQ99804.1 hypothetical protein C8P68_102634 [Mucilaginibacter yixingensis]
MKTLYKSISGMALAGLLLLSFSQADAQRVRGGFRGGVRLGFGGPRFGLGFSYRPIYPRVGFYINTLPYGYYPFYYGPDMYYYWGGTFYRQTDNGYQVAAPPIGAIIPKIPSNAHPITIDGVQYYELNGVYYKETVDEKGKKAYIVSGKDGVLNTDGANGQPQDEIQAPQVGDIVTDLPDGCHKVTLNGKKYWVSPDDIYYEEFTDANNQISYRIASIPEADDQNAPAPAPAPAPPQKPSGNNPGKAQADPVYNNM